MWIVHLWWWLQHFIGMDNASGPAYLFWSGFFGDLAIFGAIIAIYKQHNCSIPGCPRIAHHKVDGTTYKTCHTHATKSHHAKLQADHKEKRPKQHEFMKGRE